MLNSDNSPRFSCSRNAHITFVEKSQFKNVGFQNCKMLVSNSCLIGQSFKRYSFEESIGMPRGLLEITQSF